MSEWSRPIVLQDNLSSYEYVIKRHQGLVYHVVNRFRVSAFDRDDLIQAGMMGLLTAAKRYDINRHLSFSTYAIPFIMGMVKREYHKQNSIVTSDYYGTLIRQINRDKNHLTIIELSEKYKTSIENVVIAINMSSGIIYLKDEDLERLPDNQEKYAFDISNFDEFEKQIFQMRIIENLSQAEIADILHLNQSTICRRLQKMAQKVQDN